jgi:hypothetical protein
MGNRWGAGKEDGEGKGGGGQYTSNLGPEWTGIAPHAKEGFQVSKRGSGRVEGLPRQRGITKGTAKGIIKGIVPCASDIMSTLHISCQLCVCSANKELCLGYR